MAEGEARDLLIFSLSRHGGRDVLVTQSTLFLLFVIFSHYNLTSVTDAPTFPVVLLLHIVKNKYSAYFNFQ